MGHHLAGCRPSDPSSGRALLRMTISYRSTPPPAERSAAIVALNPESRSAAEHRVIALCVVANLRCPVKENVFAPLPSLRLCVSCDGAMVRWKIPNSEIRIPTTMVRWCDAIPNSSFLIPNCASGSGKLIQAMTRPPITREPTSRLVPAIVTGLALAWTAGVVVAPWLSAHDSILGSWLRLLYRPGCHQMSERCLDFGFGPMAVCARCMGLYIGGCLGLMWTTVRNRSARPRPSLAVGGGDSHHRRFCGGPGRTAEPRELASIRACPSPRPPGRSLPGRCVDRNRPAQHDSIENPEFQGRDSVG